MYQRLLNLARERKEDFGLILTKYGLERVLYRILNQSTGSPSSLKGALLFELWTEQRYRCNGKNNGAGNPCLCRTSAASL